MNKIMKITLAILMIAMICVGEQAIAQEDYMTFDGINYTESYKNAGESNPLFTQRFGADPGVMEYDGRVYVYTTNDVVEHDLTGAVKENTYGKVNKINCISSADLVNWTDHGAIPVAGNNGGIATWASLSWAPCAAHKTIDGKEKFFLYFCNGGNGIGVLCADSPFGPFRDELNQPLVTRQTANCSDIVWLFDPAVMVDEDGIGYLVFGGGIPSGGEAMPRTSRIVRLGEDMMSLDGDPVVIDAPYLFEDSGINKIGDKYVYSYCSNWNTQGNTLGITNAAIEYMTADDPLGPYTYAGEIFRNIGNFFGIWGNNHHSIIQFKGSWYLFYHARSVEAAMGITGNYRSPMFNRMTVMPNGNIYSVRGTMNVTGLEASVDPYAVNRATQMSRQAGLSVKGVGEDTMLYQIDRGDWFQVKGVRFEEGASKMTVCASSKKGCLIRVMEGDLTGEVLCEIVVPAGSDLAEYSSDLNTMGTKDLCFAFSGDAEMTYWYCEK